MVGATFQMSYYSPMLAAELLVQHGAPALMVHQVLTRHEFQYHSDRCGFESCRHSRRFAAPQGFAAPVQPSIPTPECSFAVNLRLWPDTGWFWPRAHVIKELEFVAPSLSRFECRTFSSLELAS